MIAKRIILTNLNHTYKRYASNEAKKGGKRFMQTIPVTTSKNDFYSGLKYPMKKTNFGESTKEPSDLSSKWSKHSLGPMEKVSTKDQSTSAPARRSRASKFSNKTLKNIGKPDTAETKSTKEETKNREAQKPAQPNIISTATVELTTPKITENEKPAKKTKQKRTLRPRKALITLSSNAVEHLKNLLDQPEPQLIRIGVQNRGCSGLTYNLEYVSEPGKFDERVEQDGVKVYIDSKALFSIVGSEMDWLDDKLSSRFIFRNPNSKGTCGCGESFMV